MTLQKLLLASSARPTGDTGPNRGSERRSVKWGKLRTPARTREAHFASPRFLAAWLLQIGCSVTMTLMKILLDPLPGEGGGAPAPSSPSGPLNNPTPQPAAPPAAATVLSGTKSERELQLEEENKKLVADKKRVEVHAAELEDENHRLKTPPADPDPAVEQTEEDGTWRVFDV